MLFVLALMLVANVGTAEAAANFGTTEVGQPVDEVFQFFHRGGQTRIRGIQTPAGFAAGWDPFVIQPNSYFYVQVRLLATAPGTYGGVMTIFLEGGEPSIFISLTGTVIPACTTPSVNVTSPAAGSTKTPNGAGNIFLEATASDATNGISRVDFLVDGVVAASDHVAPYIYAWPAKQGSHTVTAKAYNGCGNSATSAKTFNVDCGPISVSLTSPSHGATVSPNHVGNVILQATASHSTGIQKVNFFVDGVFQQTDITAPYAWAWPAVLGQHVLAARATSNCGNAQTSNQPTITVVP